MATETELVFHCIHCNTEIDNPETMEGMCADCYWDTEELYRGKPLQFSVYRGTHLYPLACMFDDERLAIQREVEKIVGDAIEVDVLLDDEEAYRGVVKCSEPARLMEFQGKIFKITPEECCGLSWGDNIQIEFETILCDGGCGCK